MSGLSDPDPGDYFGLEISRHSDGTQTVDFSFESDGSLLTEAPSEREQAPNAEVGVRSEDHEPEEHKPEVNELPVATGKKLENLTDQWVGTAISFFEVVPKLTSQNFSYANNELAESLRVFGEGICVEKIVSSDGETEVETFKIPNSELAILAGLMGKSTHTLKAADYLNRSALAALMAEYEAFISNLLRIVGEHNPSAFVQPADTITLGELNDFSSLDDVKSELVASKIDDLLHSKSHVQVLNWVSDKFGVNLISNKQLLAEFTEICQRRHLLTHAGGIVNKRYLRICLESGLDEESLPALGDKVKIGRHYIRRATARVFQVGFFSSHLIWQKLLPKEVDESCSQILQASHDFLENDLTKMCARLSDFVVSSTRPPKEKIVASLVINKALSFLFDPKLDEAERDVGVEGALASRDWSMISPTFQLALACISREFDDLERLAKAAFEDGVGYYEANTWVVFREARERPEFLPVFKRTN